MAMEVDRGGGFQRYFGGLVGLIVTDWMWVEVREEEVTRMN